MQTVRKDWPPQYLRSNFAPFFFFFLIILGFSSPGIYLGLFFTVYESTCKKLLLVHASLCYNIPLRCQENHPSCPVFTERACVCVPRNVFIKLDIITGDKLKFFPLRTVK